MLSRRRVGQEYPLVADGLDDVRRRLLALATPVALCGDALAIHVIDGKLLRVRFVLLAAALGSAPDRDAAIRFATLIECIHAGALCHDDVVDRSCRRRGRPTLACAFGPRTAVLAGLFLMARGLQVLGGDGVALRRVVARALRDVSRGQTDELHDLFACTVAPEAYLRRAYGKTGALYELAGRLGAGAAGLDEAGIDAVARCGAAVGVAFQLADDVRDLVGGRSLGREPGTDIREGVYTLPVLLTLAGRCPGGETLRALLAGEASTGRLQACAALLNRNGAFEAVVRLAGVTTEDGIAALHHLPPSDARDALEAHARAMVGGTSLGGIPAEVPLRTPAACGCDLRRPTAATPPLAPGLAALVARPRSRVVDEALREFRSHAGDAPSESAAAAVAIVATILEAATEVGTAPGTLVGTIDLLVAELFELASALPSAAVEVLAERLVALLGEATTRSAEAGRRTSPVAIGHLLELARRLGETGAAPS